jgi:hypothetical protein
MTKRLIAAVLGVAGATAAVVGVSTPVQAQPNSCTPPNYTSNWVGITCTGGTGRFAVKTDCQIPASGGQTRSTQGPWKAVRSTPVTNYVDCSTFGGASYPVRGSARLVTSG